VHHCIREQPGCVDHPAAAKIAAVGAHAHNAPPVHDKVLKLGFQQQLYAVLQRIFGGGNHRTEGIYQAGSGQPQRPADLRTELRLAAQGFFCREDFHARHAVLLAAGIQVVQFGALFGANCHNIAAAALKGNAQFRRHLVPHGVGAAVHLGLQRAGDGVVPGVNNGRVGRGRPHANIRFLLNQQHLELIPRKLAGCHTAHHTAADDDDVVDVAHGGPQSLGG